LVKRQLASYGTGLRARNPWLFFQGKGAEVHVGDRVLQERGVRFSLADNAKINIDDDTYLGDGTILLAVKEIKIGKGCAISWHVLMMDTSSHPIGFEGEKLETKIDPIVIATMCGSAAGP
jgi:acetyltransferase-like isoleucine patch superfamily enzyme